MPSYNRHESQKMLDAPRKQPYRLRLVLQSATLKRRFVCAFAVDLTRSAFNLSDDPILRIPNKGRTSETS